MYEIKAEQDCDLYVCMSVIRPISTVSRNVSCLLFIHMYSHYK